MKSYLAFTLQFINSEFKLEKITLECQPFPGVHDAAAICERLTEMIFTLNLNDKRIQKYLISDNGSNMLAALEEPSEARKLDSEISAYFKK